MWAPDVPRVKLEVSDPQLDKIVKNALDAAPELVGDGIIDTLQSATSAWPVRTGASKAGFGHRVEGDRIKVTNEKFYAIFVENKKKPGRKTIRKLNTQIVKRLNKQIEERL